MKMFGQKVEGPNVEYIVIPRGNGKDVVFKAQAVLDTKQFEELCKPPVARKVMKPGGVMMDDPDDGQYKDAIKDFANLRYSWIVINSLKVTEGLEWETVKFDDPSTWNNWEVELTESGFSRTEIQYIQLGVANANALNQDKIDEARNRFLLSVQPVTSK